MTIEEYISAAEPLIAVVLWPLIRVRNLVEDAGTFSREEDQRIRNIASAIHVLREHTFNVEAYPDADFAALPVEAVEVAFADIGELKRSAVQSKSWAEIFQDIERTTLPVARESWSALKALDEARRAV